MREVKESHSDLEADARRKAMAQVPVGASTSAFRWQARLDAPGTLHHVMVSEIEKRKMG
jgi:hypothetical protein